MLPGRYPNNTVSDGLLGVGGRARGREGIFLSIIRGLPEPSWELILSGCRTTGNVHERACLEKGFESPCRNGAYSKLLEVLVTVVLYLNGAALLRTPRRFGCAPFSLRKPPAPVGMLCHTQAPRPLREGPTVHAEGRTTASAFKGDGYESSALQQHQESVSSRSTVPWTFSPLTFSQLH